MVTRTRTVDLLPEIFRTETNKKFLSATLDQLVQPSKLQRIEGYIGRRTGPGVTKDNKYLLEPDKTRTSYQLEPSVIFNKANTKKVKDLITYPGVLDALNLNGAPTNRHDRMFSSEFYTWDPFIDYDKFVNFGQYYWLSGGPDSVNVQATEVGFTNDYTVTRTDDGYNLSGVSGDNPTITLLRGGNYTFKVQQTGNGFWLQTNPGTSGTIPGQENYSSRDILGVTNNGEDNGTVTFNVPMVDAQDFYHNMTEVTAVDLATTLKFDEINNQYVDVFNDANDGIDEILDLNGRTIVFLNRNTDPDGAISGWRQTSRFDDGTKGFDEEAYDAQTDITTQSQRYGVWQIEYQYDNPSRPWMKLKRIRDVNNLNKFEINYGTTYASKYFYKDATGYFTEQPLLTATRNTLYYQDANDETKFGVIKVLDEDQSLTIDVEDDIVGKKKYTSPNGVVFTNGLKVKFRGNTEPAEYQDKDYYVEGVGSAIQLLPASDFRTPETYLTDETLPFDSTAYDATPFEAGLNSPKEQDYITINKASKDGNPWTRSNRWTHIDVLNKTAEYNNTIAVLDQNKRAKRPIIEFKAGLRLHNYGTEGKAPVDIIDFKETDALSNVNGTIGYSLDGYSLVDGSRIIFAKDTDPEVRNKIYQVSIVDQDNDSTTDKIIILVEATDASVSTDQTVYVLSGNTLQGKSYRYTGTEWKETQQKTKVNQEPLFDIFDVNGRSIGDGTYYPSTNFLGTKLFSYAAGSGAVDSVLNKRLKYQTINNVGDIVFDNNLEKDTFTYTVDKVSTTKNINIGFIHNYSNRTTYAKEIGWKKHVNKSTQAQILTFTYSGSNLVCDVPARSATDNAVVVYVDNKFYNSNKYTYTTSAKQTTIAFKADYVPKTGASVEVRILSDKISDAGFYEIPENLANNAINGSFTDITLGTIRNHYQDLAQNIPSLTGTVLGSNNIRDLGDVVPYGNRIVQQGSPLHFAATFVRDSNINFFDAVDYAGREYEKYKNKLIEAIVKNDFTGTTADKLDKALKFVNTGKNGDMPFYWTDTIPCGDVYSETSYTITAVDDEIFDLSRIYDFKKANANGLIVYKNDVQLVKDYDYTVATDAARLTISATLTTGDVVKIREYETTFGSYVPSTPTKLGLYNKYKPEIVTDDTYIDSKSVIIGHDGSKTLAWGDERDEILLEFEKRIYNNIKWTGDIPLCLQDVAPGKFRTTDYTSTEVNEILGTDFLRWVAWNRLDYKVQDYDENDQRTWNYSKASDTIDGEVLLGHWRGIFNDFYDTDIPHVRPWEMIGFTEKPTWWNTKYGPAPYTSENKVLWDDLEAGRIWDGVDTYTVDNKFKRPGLAKVIPVTDEGAIRTAFVTMVRDYDYLSLKKSWVVGDQGPVETAWKRSSSFPFAVMRLLALTKPAEFFALNADRDLYKYDSGLKQYLYDGRSRLRIQDLVLYGSNTPKHSYVNWSVDYARKQGIPNNTEIEQLLDNIDIRLTYRMGSFSDHQYLKVFTEKTSPNSNNTSLLLPDESYQIFLYNNETFDSVEYSSVIVQKVENGYAVYGNSKVRPYFNVFSSVVNGNYKTIAVGTRSVRVQNDFNDTVVKVPYGYVFTSIDALSDFIVSYGRYLESKGYQFEVRENNYLLDWYQMISEAVYWSQQGWSNGAIINLNPGADELKVKRDRAVVAPILGQSDDDFVLNQNLKAITNDTLVYNRIDNEFSIKTTNENALAYVNTKFTSYEHVMVFDNKSIFNDLIYDPATSSRQLRLKINGWNTAEWNGNIEAQGFVFNQDNVADWDGNKEYSKGEIVLHKNVYYTAVDTVEPSTTFNYGKWTETEWDQIKKGMLPNLSLKSDQLRDYYDHNVANLERDGDLLGFHLIGFTPRDYLTNMNLDDVSQVNVYENYIGNKGTKRAVDLFKSARLEKELSDYQVYENWAVKSGIYGANANSSYIEFKLSESLLSSNPSTLKLVNNGESSNADQTVQLDDIYKQSYKVQASPLLPTKSQVTSENSLPTAGYVNVDDIDIQAFNSTDIGAIVPYLDKLNNGTTVWVAKDNAWDWDVYRISAINSKLNTVTDNLDGTSTLTFDAPHLLAKNDIIAIRYFDGSVNYVYRVQTVVGINKIKVALSLEGDTTEISGGDGLLFKFNTVRVAQPSDIINLPFVNELGTGNKVWVDNSGSDKWQVLQKQNPFKQESRLETIDKVANTNFGSSVTQNLNNLTALVGNDLYNSGQGAVYTFVKTADDVYAENSLLQLTNTTAVAGYGNAVDSADETWMLAGASQSNSGQGYVAVLKQLNTNLVTEHQLLVTPDDPTNLGNFGDSVAISADGRWAYVGAPGKDRVYAYQRIDRQKQQALFTGDGSTVIFDVSNQLMVSAKDQITITVGTATLDPADYTFVGNIATLDTAPAAGRQVAITRNEQLTFTGDGSTTTFDVTGLYTLDGPYSMVVTVNGALQRPELDYSYEYDSSLTFTFTTAPTAAAEIIIRSSDYFEHVATIAGSEGERFGDSVATTTDGRQVMIGATQTTSGGIPTVGKVYVYDRDVQRIQQTTASNKSFTSDRSPQGRAIVKSNGAFLQDSAKYLGGTYTITGSTVTLATAPALGDLIEIETNNYELVDTIEMASPNLGAQFGDSVIICPTNCSVYASAPSSYQDVPQGGNVTRAINQSRIYGTITGTVANPTVTTGHKLRINNHVVTFTGTTLASVVTDINNADIPNVIAKATTDNKLNIALINSDAGEAANKLYVLPGSTGQVTLTDLGLDIFPRVQTIANPYPQEYTNFGQSISISSDALTLVVGSPNGQSRLAVTMDNGTTTFDGGHTALRDRLIQSGVVYTFDYLASASDSVTNPGKLVFGQQIVDTYIETLHNFGQAVDYKSGKLLITSPGYVNTADNKVGRLAVWNNANRESAWKVLRQEQAVVDIDLMNRSFIYDKLDKEVKTELDYIDPLQGKILGAVQENLDTTGPVDPASYNVGTANTTGQTWTDIQVGTTWWDTTNARFINHYQGEPDYRAKRWSQLFPGSRIDVYQWVESTVAPANYDGEGTVYSTTSYSVNSKVTNTGAIETLYYFWVRDIPEVAQDYGKTLSVRAMAQYITDPKSSGISYLAPVDTATVALYNVKEFLVATDRILHLEFDKVATENNVHVEYELIKTNDPTQFLSTQLYRKLVDSFAGADRAGYKVPDAKLSEADAYGVEFRPRQSMFTDRFTALKNYIVRVNSVLAKYPFRETRSFNLLNSQENIPVAGSGAWDKKLQTYSELTYQDLKLVATGYKYLVVNDEQQGNLWTIYEVQADDSLLLTRVQNYKTPNYWSYVDWYATGYSVLDKPGEEVSTYSRLETIEATTAVGTLVKVTTNGNGKFEWYVKTSSGWDRVAVEDGTIEIKSTIYDYSTGRTGFDQEVFDAQYYDQEPVLETRKIIEAINDELFINDLAIERINLITLMFEYVKSEQQSANWLVKTSLVDVEHTLRDLQEYDIYQVDNQDFVQKYIEEVKPYHVQVKEFNLKYKGEDTFGGDATDFDVPAYYNSDFMKFISPRLSNDGKEGSFLKTEEIWTKWPYTQWINNYTLSIDSVTVTAGGSGYTVAPTVTVTGTSTTPAKFEAIINTSGVVTAINVVDPGAGYTTVPALTLTGGNGTGAKAIAVTSPGTVRDLKTIMRYDRYEYQSEITDWTANTTYTPGDLVRYNNKVYKAVVDEDWSSLVESGASFNLSDFQLVSADTLTGINRTRGYYVPDNQDLGLDLGLLISGIDYPGVGVKGVLYNQNTGYDVGNFDVNPYDNLDFSEEGSPSYSESLLDTKYAPGSYADTYLGTLGTDINVEGGEYIDTYSSHSPEELVPSSIFDTLNMKVFTRPGADYERDGHSAPFGSRNWVYDGTASTLTVNFADLVEVPFAVRALNITTGLSLRFEYVDPAVNTVDYTINWETKTLTFNGNGITTGDILRVESYGIGGGNQLWVQGYDVGDYLIDDSSLGLYIDIPVKFSDIYEAMIKVNGSRVTNYTFSEVDDHTTRVTFGTQNVDGAPGADPDKVKYFNTEPLEDGDWIGMCIMGYPTYETVPVADYVTHDEAILHTSSHPSSQYEQATGDATYSLTQDFQKFNPYTAIVEVDGVRLTPAEGIEYTADGSSAGPFYLSTRNWIGSEGTFQSLIAENDVHVFVDSVEKKINDEWTLSPIDGSSERYVAFNTAPAVNSTITIFVETAAEYRISYSGHPVSSSNKITFNSAPSIGQRIVITSDNNTSELDLINRVYKGPTETGVTTVTAFDSDGFDSSAWDETIGSTVDLMKYDLGRVITRPDRLQVTVNGLRKYYGQDWQLVQGATTSLEFPATIIGALDVVTVRMQSEKQVPKELNFSIFKDMRDNNAVYRIRDEEQTTLARALSATDETIYLTDVSKLSNPALSDGYYGIVMINGERITYRTKDTATNTVTGLRRGTAGTAATSHAVGDTAYDFSQNTYLDYSYSKIWYNSPSDGSAATDGVILQNTNTVPAKFLKGENS